MITIGELARLSQSSVRTVRHYHQIGLLPEPERDSAGYRQYSVNDLIRLLQIRNLSAAGVPLSEVAEVLDAEPAARQVRFAQLDHALAEREANIQAQRRRLAQVERALGGPPVDDVVSAAWQRISELGLRNETLRYEIESTMLLTALYGDDDSASIQQLYAAILDPSLDDGFTLDMYRRVDEIYDLPITDPRVEAVVEETVNYLLNRPDTSELFDDLPETQGNPSSDAILREYVNQFTPAMGYLISETERRVKQRLMQEGKLPAPALTEDSADREAHQ